LLKGAKKMDLVKINDFLKIGRCPVTNAEYAEFVAATGHKALAHWESDTPPSDLINHPVVGVTWHDAVAYCTWLTRQLRESGEIGNDEIVRLPTDREWELAATRGDGREYPWGDEWREGHCNSREAGVGTTTPVGQYSPQGDSPFGCADMVGNVWEWTSSSDEDGCQVMRGGSFNLNQEFARCAFRLGDYPDTPWKDYGFRYVIATAS
jgi:gamma-glutamyl hercynylcysteine S-oxide synthase